MSDAANEFARPFALAEAAAAPRRFSIAATASERAALARRFALAGLDRLEAEGTVARRGVDGWRLEAELRAEVMQTCVVTLEPFAAALAERFVLDFAAPARAGASGAIELAVDDAEPAPADGILDLGEIVAQHLALALDPFPRRPGAELPAAAEPPAPSGPFAALARLKPGPGGGAA